AANLSTQTSSLIVMNLAQVLFPAMSRLSHDPARQIAAFLRAARLLALVGVPLALMQAALAAPGLRILFWEKWTDAVPVLQLLSVGTAAYVVSGSVTSLIMGQGRFGANFKMALAYVVCALSAVSVGAVLGGTIGAAGAVAGLQVVFSYIGFRVGIAGSGEGTRAVLRVYGLPVIASVVSIGPAWALGWWLAGRLAGNDSFSQWASHAARVLSRVVHDPQRLDAIVAAAPLWASAWVQAGVTALLGGVLYAGIVRTADPAGWAELATRAGAIVPARFRRGRARTGKTP
ncbi:MAG: oligosaccharide flippase family protein, partial [Thermoleophilia bacterium]|nr:oligosaccharide flippase family protein [Thermoleophilia bacterium]